MSLLIDSFKLYFMPTSLVQLFYPIHKMSLQNRNIQSLCLLEDLENFYILFNLRGTLLDQIALHILFHWVCLIFLAQREKVYEEEHPPQGSSNQPLASPYKAQTSLCMGSPPTSTFLPTFISYDLKEVIIEMMMTMMNLIVMLMGIATFVLSQALQALCRYYFT